MEMIILRLSVEFLKMTVVKVTVLATLLAVKVVPKV